MEQRYYYDTIGSWISPETSSSSSAGARGAWNQDGSAKSDGVFDDGTSIWGNPSSKKVGVDWVEKESLMNPPAKPNASNHEKRILKPDPISSLNGTEAWGVHVENNKSSTSTSSSLLMNNQQQQQQQKQVVTAIGKHNNSNDSSGNIFNGPDKSVNDQSNSWAETSSLVQAAAVAAANERKSSPSNDLVWNDLGITNNHHHHNHHKQQSQNSLDSANHSSANPSSSSSPASSSSSTQDLLKQMVHQIQLAVKAGHLNAHIMNQPMSTTTLQLVYQLLQQIETMHQLQEIQQRSSVKSDMGSPSNLDIQINRVRQNISLLQKAITQQQATVTRMKQQPSNHSYATVSKLSTNMKVPPTNSNNSVSNIINNSGTSCATSTNIHSFRRSSLIDTLSNNNSDSLRSAQATFNANAHLDKTLPSILQASSANNNILRNNNKTITTSDDFPKAQSFTNSNNINQHHLQQQQISSKGLLQAQSSAPSSSSSTSAWSAFSSGDFISQQAWPSQQQQQSRISSDHQQLFSAFDSMPEFAPEKAWRSSILTDIKDSSSLFSSSSSKNNSGQLNAAVAPGSGLGGVAISSSASNTLKKMNDKDILNSTHESSSLFCDWSNNSDSGKRNFDHHHQSSSSSISSSSAMGGGLSLQSNPWMFEPSSSTLTDWINSKNSISGGNLNINNTNKLVNGNTDKMVAGDDSLFFKQPANSVANLQRSSSALYNWSDQVPSSPRHHQQQQLQQASVIGTSSSSSGVMSQARPAPPPGLLGSNFSFSSGPIIKFDENYMD